MTGMAIDANIINPIIRSKSEYEWLLPPGLSIPEFIARFKQRFEQ